MISRRAFLSTLSLGVLTAPLAAAAQSVGNVPRIGFLSAAPLSSITAGIEAFREVLRDLSYVEGQKVERFNFRSAPHSVDVYDVQSRAGKSLVPDAAEPQCLPPSR